MTGKITLITPPDIYENANDSILFMNLSEQEQDSISQWLGEKNLEINLNLYVYNGEPNVVWLLWATNLCQYKYINLDGVSQVTNALGGYILSKNGVYYHTSDENLAAIYNHINNYRVTKVEHFLEGVFGGQTE